MKRSPEIVIIGGSQFALEVAGELRTDYPDKKVVVFITTISGTELCGRTNSLASDQTVKSIFTARFCTSSQKFVL